MQPDRRNGLVVAKPRTQLNQIRNNNTHLNFVQPKSRLGKDLGEAGGRIWPSRSYTDIPQHMVNPLFPKLMNKDTKKLFELWDLISEVESVKEDPKYASLLSYFDTSRREQRHWCGSEEKWTITTSPIFFLATAKKLTWYCSLGAQRKSDMSVILSLIGYANCNCFYMSHDWTNP